MNEEFYVICDICKLAKEISVVEKDGKQYVVCKECKDKIPDEIVSQEAPKQEIKHISAEEQLKKEKKKFEEKQRRIAEMAEKKKKEMIDMAIRSKSRTLFGGKGDTLF